MLGLLVSALFLVLSSWMLARSTGRSGEERFWIFWACVPFQLGTISTLSSIPELMTPRGWLVLQTLLSAGIGCIARFLAACQSQPTDSFPNPDQTGSDSVSVQHNPWTASLSLALALGLIACILFSGVLQYLKPVNDSDGRIYHASRCLYWIQNQSLFSFETHNDRHTDFPFGAELFFTWPILFTRLETVGRMVFWLGYPLSAAGVYLLVRELKGSRNIALAGALLFAATPTILSHAVQMKPEMWSAFFITGTAFWAVRAFNQPGECRRCFFLTGIFLALSFQVRFTVLCLLPALCVFPWLLSSRQPIRPALFRLGCGMVLGIVLSGVWVVLAFNTRVHGHPLGSTSMRRIVQAEISPRQVYTHAVRIPFLLIEMPRFNDASVRETLTDLGNRCADALGAKVLLPGETNTGWPGIFEFEVHHYAIRFSTGGILWLFAFLAGSCLFSSDLIRSCPRWSIQATSALALLSILLFVCIAFVVRWMWDVERFWIPPYALAVPVGMVLLEKVLSSSRCAQAIALAVLGITTVLALEQVLRLMPRGQYVIPGDQPWQEEPYPEVFSLMPADAHVLLICGGSFADYPMFRVHDAYSTRVFSWGQHPWDPERLRSLLRTHQITHILIEHDRFVHYLDHPLMLTGPIVQWLDQQCAFKELPLSRPHMRLYAISPCLAAKAQ